MTSKVDLGSVALFPLSLNENSERREYFTNHQRWRIKYQLNPAMGSLCFYLIDPFGRLSVTTECFVENVDPSLEKELIQLKSEEQQAFISAYLQRRVDQATPYQVHVESSGNRHMIRFGDHGLRGGVKKRALVFSIGQVGCGMLLFAGGNNRLSRFSGRLLIATGLTSGLYAFNERNEKYSWREYFKQMSYGAISGTISFTLSTFVQSAGLIARIGTQVLTNTVESAASLALSEAYKRRVPNFKDTLKKACTSGVGGGFGAIARSTAENLLGRVVIEVKEDIPGLIARICKSVVEGMASSVSNKVVTNWIEGEEISQGLVQRGVVSGLVYGGMSYLVQAHLRMQVYLQLKEIKKLIEQTGLLQDTVKQGIEEGRKLVEKINQAFEITRKNVQVYDKLLKDMESFLEQGGDQERAGDQEFQDLFTQVKDERLVAIQTLADLYKLSSQVKENMKCTLATANFSGEAVEFIKFQYDFIPLLFDAVCDFVPAVGQDIGQLQNFEIENISFVDFGMKELIPHVVLVHAIDPNATQYFERELDWNRIDDTAYKSSFLVRKLITSDGTIGSHLAFEKKEFQGELVDRPHIHWFWNQLVQPNSGGRWEDAQIAILEPLSVFESSADQKALGVTPYDTLTVGPHRLSPQAVVLVPENVLAEARAHLSSQFLGKIVPYNSDALNLRSAIIDALRSHFPETWHICDEKGRLIGHRVKYSAGGYNSKTCLSTPQGEIIILLQNEGRLPQDQSSRSMQEFFQANRFIGLHINSVTYLIETGPNFRVLQEFKKNRSIVKNNQLFAGYIPNEASISKLTIVSVFDVYERLLKLDSATGSEKVANYLLNEAMYADLVSLFYKTYPDKNFELSALDLKMIFSNEREELVRLLSELHRCIKDKESSQEGIPNLFQQYCGLLKKHLAHLIQAKEMTLKRVKEIKQEPRIPAGSDSFFSIGADDWQKVEVPTDGTNHIIDFDLGKDWPLNKPLQLYFNQVLSAIPKAPAALEQLYRQSLSLSDGLSATDVKEKYRLNVLCSIIQWLIQEKIYQELNRS